MVSFKVAGFPFDSLEAHSGLRLFGPHFFVEALPHGPRSWVRGSQLRDLKSFCKRKCMALTSEFLGLMAVDTLWKGEVVPVGCFGSCWH